MTYDALHRILLDLQKYMNGDYDKRSHWEDLGFELMAHGVAIGNGILWYVPGKASSSKLRVEARTVSNENLLLLSGSSNSTLTQPHNSTLWLLGAPIPFPVPGSPITLSISRTSTMWGIGIELFDLLAAALREISLVVEAHPTLRITRNAYKRSKMSEQGGALELNVHAERGHDVSWQDLKDVIRGLDAFYNYDPETGWYRSCGSRFDINKAGKGTIGSGDLTLVGSARA